MIVDRLNMDNETVTAIGEYFGVERLLVGFVPDRNKSFGWTHVRLDAARPIERFQWDYALSDGNIEQVFRMITRQNLINLKFRFMTNGEGYLKSESLKRLNWLKKCQSRNIVFKIHASEFFFNPELIDYLKKSFKIILLHREDRRRQMLSWCWSQATGYFDSSHHKNKANDQQYLADRAWIEHMGLQYGWDAKIRKSLGDCANVYNISYEQLADKQAFMGEMKALGLTGLSGIWDEALAYNPREKLETDYLKHFTNADELLGWIHEIEETKQMPKRLPLRLDLEREQLRAGECRLKTKRRLTSKRAKRK